MHPKASQIADLAEIIGPRLRLRLITPEDADYAYSLRTNPAYNEHLSAVTGTVEDQRAWIEAYKAREAALLELYYVIERREGGRCGLVRLYNITPDSFTWGSWILDENKPPKAALESALLSMSAGISFLNAQVVFLDVRIANTKAHSIYLWLGFTEISRDETDIYLKIDRATFLTRNAELRVILSDAAL